MVAALVNGAPAASWYSYFGLGITLILPLAGVAYLLGQVYDNVSNGVADFRTLLNGWTANTANLQYANNYNIFLIFYFNMGGMLLNTIGFLIGLTNIGLAVYNAYNVLQLITSDSTTYGTG